MQHKKRGTGRGVSGSVLDRRACSPVSPSPPPALGTEATCLNTSRLALSMAKEREGWEREANEGTPFYSEYSGTISSFIYP